MPSKRANNDDFMLNKRLLNEHLASRGLPQAAYDVFDYSCRRAPDRTLHEAVVWVTDESGDKRRIASSIRQSGLDAVEQASFMALCHFGAADTLVDMITAAGGEEAEGSVHAPSSSSTLRLIPASRLPPAPHAPVQKRTFIAPDGKPLPVHLPGRGNELFRTVLLEHGTRLVELADAQVVLLAIEPREYAMSVRDRDVWREASSRAAMVLSDKWAFLSIATGKMLAMYEYMVLLH